MDTFYNPDSKQASFHLSEIPFISTNGKLLIERPEPYLLEPYEKIGPLIHRFDWVHTPFDIFPGMNARQKEIISRSQRVCSALGITLNGVKGLTLERVGDDVQGKLILVGGGIFGEDGGCVEIRARHIREQGGIPVIDVALTTPY